MSKHVHVGDPCVVCALFDILTAICTASGDEKGESVAPASLRTALSTLYPESNFFQEVSEYKTYSVQLLLCCFVGAIVISL